MTRSALALGLLALLPGCRSKVAGPLASAGNIHVEGGHSFPAINGTAAAYLTLRNDGAVADTVVGFSSPAAGSVMAHRTVTEGNASHMEMVDLLPVQAGELVTMAPGGLHLMLDAVSGRLQAGDSLTVTLHFSRTGSVTVRLAVLPYGSPP